MSKVHQIYCSRRLFVDKNLGKGAVRYKAFLHDVCILPFTIQSVKIKKFIFHRPLPKIKM